MNATGASHASTRRADDRDRAHGIDVIQITVSHADRS
jgi:hypothetical protein